MIDFEVIREACRTAAEHDNGVDPTVPLRLVDALEAVEYELLALRSIVADLDELMDSEEGPLFQPDHSCRVQRRVAQFRREVWKPNAEARGYQQVSRTWGRGQPA